MKLTPELLMIIAERFKAMGEPARLAILNTLREGGDDRHRAGRCDRPRPGERLEESPAALLLGFVTRRKEGLHVYHSLSDPDVFKLCDIMCGRLEAEARARKRVLALC